MKIDCNIVESYTCRCDFDRTIRSCGGHCSPYGYRCSTNQDAGPWIAYCEVVNSNYLTDKGIVVKHVDTNINQLECAGHIEEYNNNTYSCVGVRAKEGGESPRDSSTIYTYLKTTHQFPGNIVEAKSDSNVKTYLAGEVEQRRKHLWYTKFLSRVDTKSLKGEDIEHTQQNKLMDIIASIKGIMTNNKDYGEVKNSRTNIQPVDTGDIIEAPNYNQLETNLQQVNTECICYSDCTSFRVAKRRECLCNINCRCNY